MTFKLLASSLVVAQCVAAMRFAMYIDQWHNSILPGRDQTQGITHAIMAFAPSTLFNSDSPPSFTPFEPVSSMRSRFSTDTKVTIAIGGWGDTSGFSEGAKDETSRSRYAKNVAAMLESNGFDGVDIDWEYPGGNGQDYRQIPNSQKTWEIDAYPLFVKAIRDAIGKDKILSVAVPGRTVDMVAFTKEQGPKIWPSVDFVNVMTYDLMNRRDNVTNHHTSVEGSLDVINNYSDIGLGADKMNLGFAYYAKWFTTDPRSDCDTHPIGCAVVPLENPDGSDNGKSGVVTFEKSNMQGSTGTSVMESWQRAQKDGKTDEKAGGQYYWDPTANLFWTWDTPELIGRKFKDIVTPKKLGGVMAWSLGEDSYDWSHVEAMQKGVSA